MKDNIFAYLPFEHDNTEYINNLINYAREQSNKGSAESILASAVIYTNLVEYLATHLLKNFKQMVYLLTYHQLQGVLFLKNTKSKGAPKTLGPLKNELECYEFPDKQDFLKDIIEFSNARNALFHRLFEKDENVTKLDVDLVKMQSLAEEILAKYNVIITGITTTWQNILTVPQSGTEKIKKDKK